MLSQSRVEHSHWPARSLQLHPSLADACPRKKKYQHAALQAVLSPQAIRNRLLVPLADANAATAGAQDPQEAVDCIQDDGSVDGSATAEAACARQQAVKLAEQPSGAAQQQGAMQRQGRRSNSSRKRGGAARPAAIKSTTCISSWMTLRWGLDVGWSRCSL